MAIFDSILFEGQQADEYRKRKEIEGAISKAANEARDKRRYGYGDHPGAKKSTNDFGRDYRGGSNRELYAKSKPDNDRDLKTLHIVSKEEDKRNREFDQSYNKYKDTIRNSRNYSDKEKEDAERDMKKSLEDANRVTKNINYARDAANRHLRRHGSKNESVGIFESVELI